MRHLEVLNAPKSFEGRGVFGPVTTVVERESRVRKFASLETVKVTGCSGVTGASIVQFMRSIGMLECPKEDRLRCLRLAGCDMQQDEDLEKLGSWDFRDHLDEFKKYLSIEQREVFCEIRNGQEIVQVRNAASVIDQSSFDLWECNGATTQGGGHEECKCVATSSEVAMCILCMKTYCGKCADIFGTRYHEKCASFVCFDCDEDLKLITCDSCNKTFCEPCWERH